MATKANAIPSALAWNARLVAVLEIDGTAVEAPVNVFVVHGESGVAESFSDLVHQKLGWNSRAPKDGDSVVL